jgi:hypothetical protein
MVSRPLADPPARRGPGVMRAAVLALLLLASSAEALDVSVEPYRQARQTRALGVVTGRVYAEQRTLRVPARPMTGTTVTLLPRSEVLLARLETLKARSRESSTAFTAAAPAMRKAKEVYERELLHAGAPDLTPMVLVDQDGGFRIDDVPAGAWVLLAWHSTSVDVSTPKDKSKDKSKERNLYQPQPGLRGFQSVTVWLREVGVTGGATATVELTDRNGWFRGVVEERVLDAGH